MILEELLVSNTTVAVCPRPSSHGAVMKKEYGNLILTNGLHLDILRTCKALHEQSIMILYGKNNLRLTEPNDDYVRDNYASTWLQALGSRKLAYLTSVTLLFTTTRYNTQGQEDMIYHWMERRNAAFRSAERCIAEEHTQSIVRTLSTLATGSRKLRHIRLVFV